MEESFEQIGLNKYETRAYIALVKKSPLDGKELSQIANIPYTSVYRVVRGLIEKGLVSEIESERQLFEVIEPKIGLNSLISKKFNNLAKTKDIIIKELQKLPKNTIENDSLEKLKIFYGRDQRLASLVPIINNAKKYVYTLCNLTCHWSPEQISTRLKAKKRRIELKSISNSIKPEFIPYIKEAMKTTEIRYYPALDGIVFCVSEKVVSAGVRNPKNRSDITTFEVEDAKFAAIYTQYFRTIWKEAKPIKYVLKNFE